MILKLVILGFLKRFGKLHGYELKEKIGREVADFVNVKLSNVYYHLEKLYHEGLLNIEYYEQSEKPNKKIYMINQSGININKLRLSKYLP